MVAQALVGNWLKYWTYG